MLACEIWKPTALHIVWSNTSDRAEWQRKRAELIASGKADPGDDFMYVRWRGRTNKPLLLRAKPPSMTH
jgi:hypothetical protein